MQKVKRQMWKLRLLVRRYDLPASLIIQFLKTAKSILVNSIYSAHRDEWLLIMIMLENHLVNVEYLSY